MYFPLISQSFYSNFEREYSFDEKFNFSSKEYLCCIISTNPTKRKIKNIWKTWLQSCFSCISHFSCSRLHRKYATWVLLGWGNKCFIQRVLPLKIWVKTLGDKLKIWVEKVDFSFFPLKFDDLTKSYFIILTIIFIISLRGPFWTSKFP